jgi:hypothetical protein
MRLATFALLATVTLTVSACGSEQHKQTKEVAPQSGEAGVAAVPDECGPAWDGPWTACPEADWVQRVAERAGYRITGETGSALIAQGKGQGFYILGYEAPEQEVRKVAAREGWKPLAVVEGVVVYGDERLWRWWVVDEFILLLHAGPYEDSKLPPLDEMGALVEASTTSLRP